MESKFSVSCKDDVAEIELCGRLDAANSPTLQEELKKLIGSKISRLVFLAKDLEYISSAGLRVIIFAKQNIGADAHVYLVGAQELVINTVKMSGLDNFMDIVETYTE
jgi:anti-anti-sigma factor